MTIEMDTDIDEAMLAKAEEVIARWDARAEARKSPTLNRVGCITFLPIAG